MTGNTPIPFKPDQENITQLYDVINAHKGEKGSLIPILQKAQDIFGYLPIEVQKIIADELRIPLEKVYGTVTFYSFFNLTPRGQYQVSVCLGTACYVKGSQKVYEELVKVLGIEAGQITEDGKFSLDNCRCVGACGLAPVMLVNDDVYGKVTPDQVADIIKKYN